MNKIILSKILIIIIVLLSLPAQAKPIKQISEETNNKYIEELTKKYDEKNINDIEASQNNDIYENNIFSSYGIEKEQIKEHFNPVLKDWAEYKQFKFTHTVKIFKLQYYMSIIIFIAVLLLVFLGCYMSYMHFKKSNNDTSHEMVIVKEGIKITSPVIGLFILIISFAFFYAYLVNVYKINIIN